MIIVDDKSNSKTIDILKVLKVLKDKNNFFKNKKVLLFAEIALQKAKFIYSMNSDDIWEKKVKFTI